MWKGSSSLGVFATRITARDANLGTRCEYRARGANSGHVGRISDISDVPVTAKFDMRIFFISACKAHLGTSAHLGVLDRQGVRDASDRRRGALPRTSLTLTQRSFTRNGPCEGD